ncbi:hypothetical protein [Peribacillus frigoritolerans]|uniref:hypothetical protein n=1 Tax=Peribacillus frigoritolerans TaxID=450367 RepID=UPI002079BFCC|nr:hypothetical protein [Peribacillus frigoritolerans]USK68190.1 hypothetical protein LIT26_29630 [Peribacillus frigoritolerans]
MFFQVSRTYNFKTCKIVVGLFVGIVILVTPVFSLMFFTDSSSLSKRIISLELLV